MATVSQAVRNGAWILSRGRHNITLLLKAALPAILLLVQSLPDEFKWRNTLVGAPGLFLASKNWSALHPVGQVVSWKKLVWFSQNIPKHAFIHWMVARDRLPTRDRLQSWGLKIPDNCLLCNVVPESRSHLFFDCTYTTQVWKSFFSHPRLNPPTCLDTIVNWVRYECSISKLNIICKLLLQATIYEICKERDVRSHRAETKPSSQVTRKVQSILPRKLAGLHSSPCTSQKSSSSSAQTYLSFWFGYIQFGNDPAT